MESEDYPVGSMNKQILVFFLYRGFGITLVKGVMRPNMIALGMGEDFMEVILSIMNVC